jgi:hypothetical protein
MLGTLQAADFSLPLTAHAYAIIDAHVYGFALQEGVAAVRRCRERRRGGRFDHAALRR